jgi:hypothetical protein
VLEDAGTAVTVTFAMAGAVALVLQPSIGRPCWKRWVARWTGFVGALYATLAAASLAVSVTGRTVRAYTVDPAGNVNEPIANSHPGLGLWCAIALGLVILTVHTTASPTGF